MTSRGQVHDEPITFTSTVVTSSLCRHKPTTCGVLLPSGHDSANSDVLLASTVPFGFYPAPAGAIHIPGAITTHKQNAERSLPDHISVLLCHTNWHFNDSACGTWLFYDTSLFAVRRRVVNLGLVFSQLTKRTQEEDMTHDDDDGGHDELQRP